MTDLNYGFEYGPDETRSPSLLPDALRIESVSFTRGQNREAIVDLIYVDRAGMWPLEHRYVRHSPDGFEFGYHGSGPGECALNLLSRFIGVKEATHRGLYQDFKRDFIAPIDQEKGGAIDAQAVRDWIAGKWQSEAAA